MLLETIMLSYPNQRGELSRQSILASAYELFIGNGYHGTSMRQIAKKAGIALGGLYNHYRSKEQVFQAVFKEFHPYYEVFPILESIEAETIEQFIVLASHRMLEAIKSRPKFMNLMFIEIVEFNNVHMVELLSEFLPGMFSIVERLKNIEEKRIRNFPTPILLRTFLGMIFGYYLSELVFSENAAIEFNQKTLDYFSDIYLHGLLE